MLSQQLIILPKNKKPTLTCKWILYNCTLTAAIEYIDRFLYSIILKFQLINTIQIKEMISGVYLIDLFLLFLQGIPNSKALPELFTFLCFVPLNWFFRSKSTKAITLSQPTIISQSISVSF